MAMAEQKTLINNMEQKHSEEIRQLKQHIKLLTAKVAAGSGGEREAPQYHDFHLPLNNEVQVEELEASLSDTERKQALVSDILLQLFLMMANCYFISDQTAVHIFARQCT